ncbi:ABC transporter permease [Anatilimnocola sp. NA78]|uniref:ABC transporter permease n=1 Tax=Anatilimnocola sp. NA78 TaxID=3415683 RepID=UPI003CE5028A
MSHLYASDSPVKFSAAVEPSDMAIVDEAAGSPAEIITVIQARPGWQIIDFAEIWRFRELLFFLIWRDVKVRYKQTLLGAAWAILQPFAQMVVFSIFFGRMVDMPTGGIPYPLFVFAGLLPWIFFSNAISSAAGSVVGNQNLITKVYFPRLFVPASSIGVGLVDFGIAFGMLLLLMLYYGVMPAATLLLTPLLLIGLTAAAFGVGTLLAALTVAYRDFRYVVPFMVQLWMFATPTIYMDATAVGPRWQAILPLNPAYGLILNFRNAALGRELDGYSLGVSLAVTVAMLVVGCLYFRRVERTFADLI